METPIQLKDLKAGEHFMTATHGMRGWFACEMWMNDQDFKEHGIVFPEPWESDFSTFGTKGEAEAHARVLALMLNLPYID